MKTIETITELSTDQAREINGGGFAYDLGRAIRFLGLSGAGITVHNALVDWWINDAANTAENGEP
jgi:hypothetical protein